MRTIPPEPDEQAPDAPVKRELIFRMILPLRLFGDVYFLGLLMGRDLAPGTPPGDRSIRGRITAAAILVALLLILISGSVFLLYLVKTLSGFDLFPNAHLME